MRQVMPKWSPALGTRGAFWAAASVLALALWSSGAPSVLYPSYQVKWDLSPAVVSAVFATYQVSLIVVLLLFGSLSDRFGRRIVMIWGVGLIALSALVFAVAPDVSFLFAGRLLQGAGSGLAMGAATASLVDNNISRNPRFASSLATVSTASGLTLALVVSGVIAKYVPVPLFWSYIVLFVLALASVVALASTPDDRPAEVGRWQLASLRIAPGLRRVFAIATLAVSLAYCVGAIFLSLGAHMIGQFAQTRDTLLIGLLLGCSSATIGVTALALRRLPPLVCVWAGAALTLVSLALMGAAAASGSIAVFLLWCLIGGAAYSLSFTGGLGLIGHHTPEHHRGSTLSLLYLYAYVLQAATALGVGALATTNSLGAAVDTAAIVLGIVCIALLVLIVIDVRAKRSTTPAADPSATLSAPERTHA